MNSLLTLPHDVLVPVLQLLTQHDAVQLARVSRTAHTLAMPRVLSHVELGWERGTRINAVARGRSPQVASFTSLILRNPDDYAHHIKALTLHWNAVVHIPRVSEGNLAHLPSLVEVLRLSSNLRKLDIDMAESLLALSPELADVVAGHVRLQELKMESVGDKALSLLARMEAGLREVVLQEVRGVFVFDCLRPHIGTLEVLRLKDFNEVTPPRDGDSWSCVHTLELHGYNAHPPVTSLPLAFPHVRHLSMNSAVYGRTALDESLMKPIAWSSLDVLELSHVWLNLITPVRVLHLSTIHRDGFAPLFFEHVQPAALVLQLYDERRWLPSVQSASKSLGSLQYLQLRRSDTMLWFSHETGEVRRHRFMDTLRNLAELRLTLRAISLCHAPHPAPEDDLPAAREHMAKAIVNLFPTVELVGFGYHKFIFDTPTDYSPTIWYRVGRTRTEDEDTLVVEAAKPVEVSGITEYVENLGRTAE
ncbi:hypothetical protein OH76DRAFT_1485330 [Lentinus brumalis]|uniref:F-box domain-containing protein n=1 Tax=Lentinus brumalis TaxID=2498619 RepID=A0A371D290_9APHY|nr:hypothetical protein OH76DRAFT_1485330 [Polyporus brumalis]